MFYYPAWLPIILYLNIIFNHAAKCGFCSAWVSFFKFCPWPVPSFCSARHWITQPLMFIHQKLPRHWYTENVTDIVFFIVCEIYFFWFHRSIGFKRNKTVFTSPEALVIDSLISWVSREKKNPSTGQIMLNPHYSMYAKNVIRNADCGAIDHFPVDGYDT